MPVPQTSLQDVDSPNDEHLAFLPDEFREEEEEDWDDWLYDENNPPIVYTQTPSDGEGCRLCCSLLYWTGITTLCNYVLPPSPEYVGDEEAWRANEETLTPVKRGDPIQLKESGETPPRIICDLMSTPRELSMTLPRDEANPQPIGREALSRVCSAVERLVSPMSGAAAFIKAAILTPLLLVSPPANLQTVNGEHRLFPSEPTPVTRTALVIHFYFRLAIFKTADVLGVQPLLSYVFHVPIVCAHHSNWLRTRSHLDIAAMRCPGAQYDGTWRTFRPYDIIVCKSNTPFVFPTPQLAMRFWKATTAQITPMIQTALPWSFVHGVRKQNPNECECGPEPCSCATADKTHLWFLLGPKATSELVQNLHRYEKTELAARTRAGSNGNWYHRYHRILPGSASNKSVLSERAPRTTRLDANFGYAARQKKHRGGRSIKRCYGRGT